MRPQQNRRMSRRSNNNAGGSVRRAPNPLTRNYESSGPDVKIRGNAQHIADKYLVLARDALASGDRIISENYLQHAEHYLRIILTAQAAEKDSRPVAPARVERESVAAGSADFADTEEYAEMPQPVIDGLPGEVALVHKNGGYKKAEGLESDEENSAYGRGGLSRRRLASRRSSIHGGRRPDFPREEKAERFAAEPQPEDSAATARRDLRRAAAAYGNGAEDEAAAPEHKTVARRQKPRRSAADSEVDRPE